jgi:DNA-binding MarR family transcriptional regulator
VHATTATLATDRLEHRELLQRSPHPTDRRATCVSITDLGRKTADEATKALTGIDFGMSGPLDDLAGLRSALTAMRRATGDA